MNTEKVMKTIRIVFAFIFGAALMTYAVYGWHMEWTSDWQSLIAGFIGFVFMFVPHKLEHVISKSLEKIFDATIGRFFGGNSGKASIVVLLMLAGFGTQAQNNKPINVSEARFVNKTDSTLINGVGQVRWDAATGKFRFGNGVSWFSYNTESGVNPNDFWKTTGTTTVTSPIISGNVTFSNKLNAGAQLQTGSLAINKAGTGSSVYIGEYGKGLGIGNDAEIGWTTFGDNAQTSAVTIGGSNSTGLFYLRPGASAAGAVASNMQIWNTTGAGRTNADVVQIGWQSNIFTFDATKFVGTGVARNFQFLGGKVNFNPTATVAGLNVGSLAGDPSAPVVGDIWYNSSSPGLWTRFGGFNESIMLGESLIARINYGSGLNGVTTNEAGFEYDDAINKLTVDNIGSSSGDLSFTVPSALDFMNFTAAAFNLDSNSGSAFKTENGSIGVSNGASFTRTTTASPAVGIGVNNSYIVETSASNNETGAVVEVITTDVTAASEDFDVNIKTMAAGAAAATRLTINESGITVPALTSGRVPIIGTGGLIGDDLQLTYDAIGNTLSTSTFKSTAMSQNWVPFTNINDELVGEAGFEYNASGNVLDVPKIQINTGVTGGSGLTHGRASTGSIAAGANVLVNVTLGNTMADTNYTVSVTIEDATTSASSLRLVHVESRSTTQVGVRVENTSAGAITGTIHVIAIHD